MLFLSSGIAYGQLKNDKRSTDTENSTAPKDSKSLDSLVIEVLDTLSNDVFAYSLDYYSKRHLINDTTLTNFEEYDPLRKENRNFVNLGNPGSAAFPLFWKPSYSDQFTLGFDQHSAYKLQESDVRFYRVEKPVSQVYFGPLSDQSSFISKAILARDFAKGVSVSLDFQRLNSSSTYLNQQTRHTYINVGMIQKIDSSRFMYSLNYLSNSNYEEFNGGVSTDDLFDTQGFEFRELYPVNMEEGNTYQLSRNYSGRLYYFLQDQAESKQYLQVKLNHDRGFYKLVNDDIISVGDSMIFSGKYITSPLGMRMPISNNRTSVRLSYHLENKLFRSFYWGRYALNQVRTDLETQYVSEIVAGIENRFSWKGLELDLDGYVGTVYNSFLLDLNPKAGYNYKDKAAINFGFRLHTEPSAYSINRVEVTFVEVRNSDPFIVSSQELYGEVDVPILGFSAKLSSYAGQNIPVLDTTGLEFTKENISFLSLDVEEKLAYKWLHFNNRFATQIRTSEVYDMPLWFTQHELFLDGKLFGSLDFQAGVNVDFIPAYSLPSYSPLYGRLYHSNTDPRGMFYRIDPYASIKVQGFRFFAKYENLNDFWDDGVIMEVENYPQFDGRFRMGVSWELRN